MLNQYSSDQNIRGLIGTAEAVRFNGKITAKDDASKSVIVSVEIPGVKGLLRTVVPMSDRRFSAVSVMDTIAGRARVERGFNSEQNKTVTRVTPKNFVVRTPRGRQVV